jgi:hypothetical protein
MRIQNMMRALGLLARGRQRCVLRGTQVAPIEGGDGNVSVAFSGSKLPATGTT